MIFLILVSVSSAELSKESKPPGYIGEGAIDIIWNINYTGAEKELFVDPLYFNETMTEFCVYVKNQTKYSSELSLSSKNIAEVPLAKTQLPEQFTIPKSKLSLDKGMECFKVAHPKNPDGIEFKIGWESVVIVANTNNYATKDSYHEHLIRDSRGVIWASTGGGDVEIYNSTDEGITWNKTLDTGAAIQTNLVINDSDFIWVFYTVGTTTNDLYRAYTPNYGVNWYGPNLLDGGMDEMSCVSDGERPHCCIIDSDDELYYFNLSPALTWTGIKLSTTADNTDFCDIEVSSNGTIFIAGSGSDGDTLDLWVLPSKYNSTTSRITVATDIHFSGHQSITIDDDDNIFVAYKTTIPYYPMIANSTARQYENWTKTQLSGSGDYSHRQSTMATTEGIWYATFQEGSNDGPIKLYNSSDKGKTWELRGLLPDNADTQTEDLSLQDSNFPAFNRPTRNISMIYWDSQVDNIMFQQNLTEYLSDCSQSRENTSWSIWYNTTDCQANNTQVIERNRTEYDSAYCPGSINITFNETSTQNCIFPCNCTFPNNFALNKIINMSCQCNTTSLSWCANISYVGTGIWRINTTINYTSRDAPDANQRVYYMDNYRGYVV